MAIFKNYEEFVEKFKPKLTTDDCYTPQNVYDAIVVWCKSVLDLDGRPIVRPFYPGGDFEHYEYPENCIVIDNPPFSILSKIRRWYQYHNIDYVLFAPHLTLFGADIQDTKIVAAGDITYHNGAVVNTDFVSNCFGDVEILTDPNLTWGIFSANQENKQTKKNPRYKYPDSVITVSRLEKLCTFLPLRITRDDVRLTSTLDEQKKRDKSIFGNGYLCSDKIRNMLTDAEDGYIEKHNEVAKQYRQEIEVTTWNLSEREKSIINKMNNGIKEPIQTKLEL